MAKSTPRKGAKKSATKGRKPAKSTKPATTRRSPPKHTPTQGLYGWITHTELASADPAATKAWCAKALGWTIGPTMPMPGGDYTLFQYSKQGGGGIRGLEPGEAPHTTPTVHVADCQKAFDTAVRAGAQPVSKPERVMEGVTIALVRAPGGVLIGLSGP